MATVGGIVASRGWISRTQRAQGLIDSVRAELLDAETGERDFLHYRPFGNRVRPTRRRRARCRDAWPNCGP
jgi:hypothetical protein